MSVARIAILGAESSGKSTLAAALAEHYGTLWVPEYLREFVDTCKRVPREDDQYGIARTQIERENAAALRARRYLFCDTTPLMTALYSKVYWGRVGAPLAELDAVHDYALTLVTAPDGPWVPDGLQRESEAVRQSVHALVLANLRARGIAHTVVAGDPAQRMGQVASLIDDL
ncbi:ATP-binding protein [Massilia sp. S19_KUP03_FR1]|uniref:ATP-binding protein n=1 Tax=Massilia sp. S19_KUP03_FR1 TaxID=3025503 RepID=UPI002FCDD2F7